MNDWMDAGKTCIAAFWHRCIFSAVWRHRGRGVVVMNTTNFDGQWTRRVIERFGFDTSQGSSTRGGLRGLVDMAKKIDAGRSAAFTIDGPRGPRYVAKPGPVILARKTGAPIYPFHIGLETAWTLEKTWDLFQVPRPFSRAIFVGGPFIWVPEDADASMIEEKHREMQSALETRERCGGELVSKRAGGEGEVAGRIVAVRVLDCGYVEEKKFVRRAALNFEMWRGLGS